MTDDAKWDALAEKLGRNGSTVRFWLRDDDAVAPTPALDRLLLLSQAHGVPIALAVIPALAGQALVSRLSGCESATPIIHGWAHCNHAPAGEKKQELGLHRPLANVLGELNEARMRMDDLFGAALLRVLVPPWNRIAPELLPYLGQLDFQALSAFGAPAAVAPVPVVNTQLDPIDWRGSRGCRDHGDLIDELIGLILQHDKLTTPIGILTHHLVHDEAAWDFLQRLFKLTEGHWLSANEAICAVEDAR